MRRLLFLSLLLPAALSAQKVEFGAGGGPTFYKGDLQPRFRPLNPGAAGTLLMRYNFNRVVSAKAQVMYGLVHGNDRRSGDPFLKTRDYSFRNTVLDYALQLEYNFLNFRTHDSRYEYDWTPYLFGGLGLSHTLQKTYGVEGTTVAGTGTNSAILPFGIGIKKILGPRLNLSAEFSTRAFLSKTKGSLFDGLDGRQELNEYDDTRQSDFFVYPNTMQNDKYFHLSVTLSYLIYRVNCETPGKKFSFF